MLRDQACEGMVVHRRRAPVGHELRYRVWMLCVDVDGLDNQASRWLSTRHRFWPLSLRPSDYPRLPQHAACAAGTRGAINACLDRHGQPAADRVFLLTQPRSWGWLFNPVSFYFCFRRGVLSSVVAEITNTPWGEVHAYVLDARDQQGELEFRFPKAFHVSPFMPMGLDYRWRLKLEDAAIQITMSLCEHDAEVFFAGLYLRGAPLSARALRYGVWRYPLQSVRTLLRIYAHALKLWWKRAPFHPHPNKLDKAEST